MSWKCSLPCLLLLLTSCGAKRTPTGPGSPPDALEDGWAVASFEGVKDFEWQPAGKRGTDTGGHLRLRPRDFLKVGALAVGGGTWNGQRLVSEAWVTEVGQPLGPLGDSQYGLLWWHARFVVQDTAVEVSFARGNGGQYLFLVPSLGLSAAFTASHYNDDAGSLLPITLFGRYVLPAALGFEQAGP
ncbi:hypothetical protein [Pyxidicoccus parkwayensis]|uniref:hypothetical protein n=1 Tax=Pyxidicoccus parkwayensis TaxID=2813578 RepID=UPI001F50E2A6|nr:hypothetical protein [Pyxidicoccus parkwaysis]